MHPPPYKRLGFWDRVRVRTSVRSKGKGERPPKHYLFATPEHGTGIERETHRERERERERGLEIDRVSEKERRRL